MYVGNGRYSYLLKITRKKDKFTLNNILSLWILTAFLEKTEANPWKLTELCMFLMDYVMASLEENEESQFEQVSSHFLKVNIWKWWYVLRV